MVRTTTVGVAMLAVCLFAGRAAAFTTSCDIVTGASCFWGEGCDCDHDGYVRSGGKASKYCHFTKCPIDGNDNDASVAGIPSTYNADGDGYTTAYDCDDNDACIDGSCNSLCGPPPVDADGDGFPEGEDCDDTDANIKPGAALACCSCDVLTDPAQNAAFNCATSPCPLSQVTPADTGPSEELTSVPDQPAPPEDTAVVVPDEPAVDAGSEVQPDAAVSAPDAGPDVAGAPDVQGQPFATADSESTFVGGGSLDRKPPPGLGCDATGSPPGSLTLALVLLAALLLRRRARAALLALLVSTVLSGCVAVHPWERGTLAKAPMIFGSSPLETQLEQHCFQYREGAAGGFGGGGGGCGCN